MSEAAYAVEPERYEIIEGVKCFMTSASNEHNFLSFQLCLFFNQYFMEHRNGIASQDVDIQLDEENTFRPDVSVIVSGRASFKRRKKFKGAPDLIVEILSYSTEKNDRGKKNAAYARHGVKEYWIVNPFEKSVEVYHLIDDIYMLDDVYHLPSDKELEQMDERERAMIKYEIKVSVVPDLVINVKDVFNFWWDNSQEE